MADGSRRDEKGKLSREQRGFLALLGLPAFGLALSSTMVSTYLPVFIERLTGPAVTGFMLGGEGFLALFLPFLVGSWSDSLRTRLGGRVPFILAGTALAVAALIVMPIFRGSLIWIGGALGAFFVGYFVYNAPYYALYPDLVPARMRGRSMGFQGTFRSLGLLVTLVGGGLLLALWEPLPFLVAASALGGITLLFLLVGRDRYIVRNESGPGSRQNSFSEHWDLVGKHRDIRLWVAANSLWEAAIAALKTFVVLYFTVGIGLSLGEVSGALALVAVAAIAAAPISGRLADSYGHRPVMLAALWCFGLGLLIPLFTTNPYFLVGILPVAFSAVVLMTLPYSVLMGLLPGDHHGAAAGLFGFSRGVGVVVGPLVVGAAVEVLGQVNFLVFDATEGYAAMFLVASAFLLSSIPLLRAMNFERGRSR